jgi:hypothetical protein
VPHTIIPTKRRLRWSSRSWSCGTSTCAGDREAEGGAGTPAPGCDLAGSQTPELLRREGLVIARQKRRRIDPYTTPFASASEPNRVWCGDFKGWSRTQDGERIDPLTISDACTRYLLRC